ncbi:MAG: hypothetical protein IKF82_01205 [Bacilli bacterium]|nr:hypothetical protein [Bacilli bacterium]
MKRLLDKIIDARKLVLNTWICLWICLVVLLIMKYCFGIWYPVVIKNENLLAFNNYVDSTWLKYLILSIVYVFSGNFLYLTSSRKKGYSSILEALLINTMIICTYIIKIYTQVGVIGEIIIGVIVPIITALKTDKVTNKFLLILYPIFVQGIITLWQLQILLVRGMPVNFEDIGTIFIVIMQLDYYIFLLILWIGVSIMGLASFWLFCKDVTKLKAYKEQELAKKNPDMKVIKAIDAKIAKLEENK